MFLKLQGTVIHAGQWAGSAGFSWISGWFSSFSLLDFCIASIAAGAQGKDQDVPGNWWWLLEGISGAFLSQRAGTNMQFSESGVALSPP